MTNCRRLVVALLLLTLAKVHAQTCISDAQLSLTKIGSMPVSQDGLIHVKYAFSGNVSQAAQGVVANAAQQWNAQTGTNGVVFEQASPGQTPDIVIRSDPPNSGGCTGMNVATGNLSYNNGSWEQLVANDPTKAAGTIGHEFGHFLGMDDAGLHPNPPTIMNNPFGGTCPAPQIDNSIVRFNDGQVSAGCKQQAVNLQNPPPPPDPPPPDPGGGLSPIIIDTEGEGFQLTSADNGVIFDIRADGHPIKLGWTSRGSHNAFLVLDRNGDGVINSGKELFGNFTAQPQSDHPNGFLALAVFDKPENGGNGDGLIDEKDAVFSKLRLWIDENHDGISQPNELHSLPELGIYSLSCTYQESRRVDIFGNQFRYRARVNPGERHDDRDGRLEAGRLAYDIFLVTQ